MRSSHIYLVVFTLKNPCIKVIDSSSLGDNFEDRYGKLLTPLTKMFFMYLEEISHPKAKIISNEKVIPKRLEMAWRTVENKCDCGIFAMRYMETYAGQPISKWKPGFPKEGLPQENML